MVSKQYKWLRKLQEWFLGKEESSMVKPTRKKAQYGRLEADDRSSELRVVHQYPKQGKFRFPVIEDTPQTKKVKEKTQPPKIKQDPDVEKKRVVSTYQGTSQEYTSSNEKKRELFTNSQFKPTAIPSPVYGFKQREKEAPSTIEKDYTIDHPIEHVSSMETDDLHKEENQHEVVEEMAAATERDASVEAVDIFKDLQPLPPSEVVSLTQEFEKDYETERIINREENTIDISHEFQEPTSSPSEPKELQIQSELSEKTSEYQEKNELLEGEQQLVVLNEFISEVAEEKRAELKEAENDEQQEVASSSERKAEQDQVNRLLERAITEEKIENDSAPQFEDNKPKKIEGTVRKQQESSSTKKTIPYNVLMLPQDRMEKSKGKHEVFSSEQATYQFPPINMLNIPPRVEEEDTEWLNQQGELLESTLQNFNVSAKVVHVTKGPSVTRFEIQPAPGVKVSKITGLTDDIKLCLAAKDIRMEAPIPGKHAIGIEVPNMKSSPVFLREILRRGEFQQGSPLTVALGLDIAGQPIVTDLAKMPHGLVAGATGSGKSVCINSILISLLYKATPDQVKLLLVDPKMVELAPYNELPHLVTPVITDAKQATAALKWVVAEMDRRYELFSQQGVRDIGRYNDLYSEDHLKPALPYMVVVIDELADLMMVSPQDVEESICRIAQKARACGIHLLLATQRPSVDVITGLLKANIPTRIAFSVSSQVDSRTIIDMNGAERLLGKGDMLFHENGTAKPVRVQGTFVSDEEIERVIEFVKKQRKPEYLIESGQLNKGQEMDGQDDDLFEEACYFVIEQDGASASSLQRRFRVGYNRAARLIEMMEAKGIVSEAMGSKPRHILMSITEFEQNILSSNQE